MSEQTIQIDGKWRPVLALDGCAWECVRYRYTALNTIQRNVDGKDVKDSNCTTFIRFTYKSEAEAAARCKELNDAQ